jgi:flagellar motor component MotA
MMGRFHPKITRFKLERKISGIFGLLFFVFLSVWYALRVEGIIIDNYFASIPSLGIVLAFSGLTYAKKDKYKFHQLGKVLKKDLILGGWIGTLIGIMLTFGLADNSVNNNFGDLLNSIGMAMITLLYGYMIGNIVESCWPKKE